MNRNDIVEQLDRAADGVPENLSALRHKKEREIRA